MSKICFVSFELHLMTMGGCGVLLRHSAEVLLERGHQVIFLLDMPKRFFNLFDPQAFSSSRNCFAYHVEELCADIPLSRRDFPTSFLWNSYRFHWALTKVGAMHGPDFVEFFDYSGPAYYAIAAKIAGLAHERAHLGVRLHSTNELLYIHTPAPQVSPEWCLMYGQERQALRLAETVLAPSGAFLEEEVRPIYDRWLGRQVISRPVLTSVPWAAGNSEPKNVVLFYGRLFGFKGVDLFLDAAIHLLTTRGHRDFHFLLAGSNSASAPDGSASYQDYLLRRVPEPLRSQIRFTGHLKHEEVEKILPQVLCAVFPNHLESFCYAAHELQQAGVPIVLNDIPAFRASFVHDRDALFFDGTLSDLSNQIERLVHDKDLRDRIKRPHAVTDQPLGNVYDGFRDGWIRPLKPNDSRLSVLVCVVADSAGQLDRTLGSLRSQRGVNFEGVVLTPVSKTVEHISGGVWFLGGLFGACGLDGTPRAALEVMAKDTLLLLRAGDVLHQDHLQTCVGVLERQPELSFVGTWHRVYRDGSYQLETFPIDSALELVPFLGLPLMSRTLMRTPPGRMLADLFDPRLLAMGELGYLWDLEASHGPGIVVPEALLEKDEEATVRLDPSLIGYLVMKDNNAQRKRRLANYLVAVLPELQQATAAHDIQAFVESVKVSRVGNFLRRHPTVTAAARRSLRWIRKKL
ncbi:MAG: glycosyltransferase family 4 protein [Desulfomonile sp.]|nr:glycosyltransferase family 4 protein [Desulfomonile sp.]